MARSDNVVRAGLTPKSVDVETLISMLTYKAEKLKIYEGEKKVKSQFLAVVNFSEF
jgi:mannose-6-phosphate isomerase